MNAVLNDPPTKSEVELKIDVLQLKKAALVLRAVNHKLRQQILKLLHHHGKMTVTEIYVKLRLEQSVASQHLAILRKASLLEWKEKFPYTIYSINKKVLAALKKEMNAFFKSL